VVETSKRKAWPTSSSNREEKVCMYMAVIEGEEEGKKTEEGKERWQYVKKRSSFPNERQRKGRE
jgi:hypothetical protein